MKHIALYFGMVAALVASCSTQEEDFNTPLQDDVIFYASFEQPAEDGTRVYANEDLLLRWTADDRVSIFNKLTYNQEYKFLGETGDNAGGFNRVDNAEFVTGNPLSHVVSVYPYQASTKITEDETLSVTLPSEQHYAENTFGLGDNTMVSVSSDNVLQYKNVGGYLRLSLYGEGISVSSITLKGNNGEKLAGRAMVTMPLDGTPTVTLAEDAVDQITLVCDTPVPLGATTNESVDFWFVLPPVTFSKGFTVIVSGNRGVFEKATEKTLTIERNNLSKMSSLEVEIPLQPNNVIYYTSTDGTVVTPRHPEAFGAKILSNEYVDGLGTISFDGDVTNIGLGAFELCSILKSISIPNSVTSIGNIAFELCSSLESIIIPESVTCIERAAFSDCSSLRSITIPGGVTSIGEDVFARCFSMESFKGKYASPDGLYLIDDGVLIAVAFASLDDCLFLPDGLTGIGEAVFLDFSNLTQLILPDGMKAIGDDAFRGCRSLADIVFPDSVTSIGEEAFLGCSGLTSILLPNRLTSIGNSAFVGCSSLLSITIPESVTSIGENAFFGCSSLRHFNGKYASADGLFLIDGGALLAVAYGSLGGTVTIPNGVTSIGFGFFTRCSNIVSIILPDGLKDIGDYAFDGCTNLASITIPDSVTSIGDFAFWGCTSLASITIKPEVPPTGGRDMFINTNNALLIYVPSGSVDAYKEAEGWSTYAYRILAIPERISIDGDFSDWIQIEGVSNGSYGMFKAASDADNLYFYTYRTTDGRYTSIWGGGGYIYLGFDLDGNPENGVTLNENGPYDFLGFFYPYGGTAVAPAIELFIDSDFCSWAPVEGYSLNNMQCKGVANEKGAYIEYSIPRKDLPTIPNTPISITSWGNKDLSKVTLTCTL